MTSGDLGEAVAAAREMMALEKLWVAGREIPWKDSKGKPKGFGFRAALTVDGLQPEGLLVTGYFKPTDVSGVRDKISFSLIYGVRIFGVDDNGESRHRNDVGIGRPWHGQRVNHPQIHTVSDDGIEGYAEQIDILPMDALWDMFITEARILGAPKLTLPEIQRSFRL